MELESYKKKSLLVETMDVVGYRSSGYHGTRVELWNRHDTTSILSSSKDLEGSVCDFLGWGG